MKTKKMILLILAVFMSGLAIGQTPTKKAIRQMERQLSREVKDLEDEGWDIILDDPIEVIPDRLYPFYVTNVTNWGREILLPNELLQRIQNECKGKVILKITDTGGLQTHPALEEGQMVGSNYSSSEGLEDVHGHGTHVAGIAVAAEFGLIYKLVDQNLVKWKPVKFLGDSGQGSYTGIINGVETEEAEDAKLRADGWEIVYNGSWSGSPSVYEPLNEALRKSSQAGAVWVFAAGNTGGPVNFPANSPYVLATASLDQSLTASSFSSRGPQIDMAYPGRGIVSTYKNDGYASLSGTSMASPFFAAAVVLAKSRWPGKLVTVDQVRKYFASISTDIKPEGRDDPTGWGIAYVRAILDNDPGQAPPPPEEICDNGVDDDGDGLVDCDDPDCEGSPACDEEPPPPPEDCDNGLDDDGDGLVDCDDPDCEKYSKCQPDPDPGPIKPQRDFTIPLPEYNIKWRIQGESEYNVLRFQMMVSHKSKRLANLAIQEVLDNAEGHFKNRSYGLSKNSDFYDAAFWVAYFYRLIEKKEIDVRPIMIKAWDESGRVVILEGEDLARIKGVNRLFLPQKRLQTSSQ